MPRVILVFQFKNKHGAFFGADGEHGVVGAPGKLRRRHRHFNFGYQRIFSRGRPQAEFTTERGRGEQAVLILKGHGTNPRGVGQEERLAAFGARARAVPNTSIAPAPRGEPLGIAAET